MFEAGGDDRPAVASQRTLTALARSAGLVVRSQVLPGGRHSFTFFSRALSTTFAVLCGDLDLTVSGHP